MIPNLLSCLWQKKKNPISGAQIFSQKNRSVFFVCDCKSQRFRDFEIAAFSGTLRPWIFGVFGGDLPRRFSLLCLQPLHASAVLALPQVPPNSEKNAHHPRRFWRCLQLSNVASVLFRRSRFSFVVFVHHLCYLTFPSSNPSPTTTGGYHHGFPKF